MEVSGDAAKAKGCPGVGAAELRIAKTIPVKPGEEKIAAAGRSG